MTKSSLALQGICTKPAFQAGFNDVNPHRFTHFSLLLTGLRWTFLSKIFMNPVSRSLKVSRELFFAKLVRTDSNKVFQTIFCVISYVIDQLEAEFLWPFVEVWLLASAIFWLISYSSFILGSKNELSMVQNPKTESEDL